MLPSLRELGLVGGGESPRPGCNSASSSSCASPTLSCLSACPSPSSESSLLLLPPPVRRPAAAAGGKTALGGAPGAAATTTVAFVKSFHKRRPAHVDKSQLFCHFCGRRETPEWRKGPAGPATLCNACGLQWAKKQKSAQTGKRPSLSNPVSVSVALPIHSSSTIVHALPQSLPQQKHSRVSASSAALVLANLIR